MANRGLAYVLGLHITIDDAPMTTCKLEADRELLQLGRTFQPAFVMWLEGGRELRRELDQPLREIAERIMSSSAVTLAGFDLQLLAMAFAWYRWWPRLIDQKDEPAAVMLKHLLTSATAALPRPGTASL